MSSYDLIRDLPVVIDAYELGPLEAQVSSEFTRMSTVIHLHGAGEEGVGEDVTYDQLDHIALQDAGAVQPLAGLAMSSEGGEEVRAREFFNQYKKSETLNQRQIGSNCAAAGSSLAAAGDSAA